MRPSTNLPSNGVWYGRSIAVLRALNLPLGAPSADIDDAVRGAYPFGERAYHPYKEWLRAVKDWRRDRDRLRAFSGGAA